jgi:hypothetical protein
VDTHLEILSIGSNSSVPPKNVSKQYQTFGWSVFLFFLTIFVACAFTLIFLKYKARENPAIQFTLEEDVGLQFPSSITICPDAAESISWHYFDVRGTENTDITGLNTSSSRKIEVSHIKEINFDCIIVDLTLKVLKIPAALELAVVWSQRSNYYSDLYVTFDKNFLSSNYIASGIYNSSSGVSNNVDLKLEKYSYLSPSKASNRIPHRWTSSVTSTSYFFYTISESAVPITCNTSNLMYTDSCTTQMTTCSENLRSNQHNPCAMMSILYFTLNTNYVSKFDEIDPVQWSDIIGTLGGYWVLVGSGFGLFFGLRKDTG